MERRLHVVAGARSGLEEEREHALDIATEAAMLLDLIKWSRASAGLVPVSRRDSHRAELEAADTYGVSGPRPSEYRADVVRRPGRPHHLRTLRVDDSSGWEGRDA
jgi:hypothetical protein